MTSRAAVPDLRASLGLYARALEREHPALKGPAHGPDGAERRNPFSECHECALLNDFTNGRLPVAAISSSSATETQDEPRTEDEFRERPCPACGAALAPADTHWNLMTDAYECPVATETQDGERHYQRWHRDSKHDFGLGKCAVCDKPWPCPDAATPTPDDRDREVEE